MIDETNKSNIRGAIVQAVAFFDMFHFPLTESEIYLYLSETAEPRQIKSVLRYLSASGTLEASGAFWHLPGRADFVRERAARYLHADRKYRRACFVVRFFRLLPWVRLVALANQIGPRNLRDGGDIDLFIVTARGRLWLTRLGLVFITMILRLRPQINDTRDKICLSFFVDEDHLALDPLRLSGEADFREASNDLNGYWVSESEYPHVDHYFSFWLAGLTPLYDATNYYKRLLLANPWLREHLPNWRPWVPASEHYYSWGRPGVLWNRLMDVLFAWLEPSAQRFQLAFLPADMKASLGQSKRVVAASGVLKMHLNDRRAWFGFEYLKRLRKWL